VRDIGKKISKRNVRAHECDDELKERMPKEPSNIPELVRSSAQHVRHSCSVDTLIAAELEFSYSHQG